MRILVIGQSSGGNAKIWFDYYAQNDNGVVHHVLCKNRSVPKKFDVVENRNFKVYRPLDLVLPKRLSLLWMQLYNRIIVVFHVKILHAIYTYDLIHFHGNYAPEYTLRIMNSVKNVPTDITLYGSDFYQKYLYGTKQFKVIWEESILQSDIVSCNHDQIANDFKENKVFESKDISVGCLGVNPFWFENERNKRDDTRPVRFLSTRAPYAYNNVRILLTAFCKIYGNNSSYELVLLSGYGGHGEEKSFIKNYANSFNNVIVRFDEWISDNELREYYDSSVFNFCIGDWDQLSVSIVYGFARGCYNVLSDLPSYGRLNSQGFKNFCVLDEVTEDELIKTFMKMNGLSCSFEDDSKLAEKIFCMSSTYGKFLKRYL